MKPRLRASSPESWIDSPSQPKKGPKFTVVKLGCHSAPEHQGWDLNPEVSDSRTQPLSP